MREEIEEALHKELQRRKETIALAESCTGGALAECFTKRAGASSYFLVSLVTYSNESKETFLHIPRQEIEKYGAVSEEIVKKMAEDLFITTKADWVIAVSGIAGPGGGSKEKPVGTVWAAIGKRGEPISTGLLPIKKNLTREAVLEEAICYILSAIWQKMVFSITPFTEKSYT